MVASIPLGIWFWYMIFTMFSVKAVVGCLVAIQAIENTGRAIETISKHW
jgi:hypothetical protein